MFSLYLLYLSRIRRHAFIDSLSTLFLPSFRSAVLSSWYSFGYILPIVFVFLYRSCRVFRGRDEFVESPRRLRVVNGDILFCFDALVFFELRWCGFPLNDASATSSPTDGFVFIFVRGAAVFVRRIRAVSHSSTRFRAWLFSVRSTLRSLVWDLVSSLLSLLLSLLRLQGLWGPPFSSASHPCCPVLHRCLLSFHNTPPIRNAIIAEPITIRYFRNLWN